MNRAELQHVAAASEPTSGPQAQRAPMSFPICPFCGTPNESSTVPCRQCGMENTQATRAATRAKLGPWYVWQAKNPAAPGMNFATLLSLVERQKVTPRSIVRGPTTHQLWRYAARVKGLSREFGICWGCGGALPKTSRVCAACKRLQQPPIHPDVLVESDHLHMPTMPVGPVHGAPGNSAVPTQPGNLTPSTTAQRHPESPSATGILELNIGDDLIASDSMAQPAVKPRMPGLRPDSAARAALLPIVDMGDEPLDSGLELAAFDLPPRPSDRHPRRLRVLRGIGLALLLGVVSLAALIFFHPELGAQYRAAMQHGFARIGAMFHGGSPPTTQSRASSDAPDLARRAADINAGAREAQPASARPGPSQIQVGPGSPAVRNRSVSPQSTDVPSTESHVTISAPPTPLAEDEERAKVWLQAANEAERRGDYRTAINHYRAILKLNLPEGRGPMIDFQTRLNLAQKHLDEQR